MSLKTSLLVSAAALVVLGATRAEAEEPAPPPAPKSDAAEAYEDTGLDVPYPKRTHFALKMAAGATFESVASTGLFGASGTFGLGADTRYLGIYGVLTGGGGRTDGGLDYYEFLFGPDLEWPVGPIRLGLRPRLGYLGIRRETNGDMMEDLRVGIGGLFGVDAFRSDGWSVGLEIEPRIDAATPFLDLFSADPTYPVYGVRAGLSVHKRIPRKHNPKLMPAPRIADRF